MEIWKDIKDFENRYQISSLGRIKSLKREIIQKNKVGNFYKYVLKERILKNKNCRGYSTIILSKNDINYTFRICRLVAIHFIPNPENKRTVNHKNGVKTDDRVENLEWCTHSENNYHAFKTGLKKGVSLSGELNPNAKISNLERDEIIYLRLNKKYSLKDLAIKYKITVSGIGTIMRRFKLSQK